MEKIKLLSLVNAFDVKGNVLSVKPYGKGHINETFIITTDARRYILQKINDYVFTDVEGLMKNVCGITGHLRAKGVETLFSVPTHNGKNFIYDGGYYRVYEFIEGTKTYQKVTDKNLFKNVGFAFGTFINALADYDKNALSVVIPDYHNTPKRFSDFISALIKDQKNRAKNCKKEIDFLIKRKDTLFKVVDGLKCGELPLRVIHNDTKINNVLIDAKTGVPRAVIDIDTVQEGSLLYDFGDAIRSGAVTANEDEKNLNKIALDLTLFKFFAEGFLSALKNEMTPKEKELLPYSVYLLTVELASRFLSDYLNGDVYFKTDYENHNLIRAKAQISLVKDVENKMSEMEKIIKEL